MRCISKYYEKQYVTRKFNIFPVDLISQEYNLCLGRVQCPHHQMRYVKSRFATVMNEYQATYLVFNFKELISK
jgi:hypothetical protein